MSSRTKPAVSDVDYDPLFSEIVAARMLNQKTETLKKWRQRRQGPPFLQYGENGVVRYAQSALKLYQGFPFEIARPEGNPAFDSQDAAIILGIKANTLRKWRTQNHGPAIDRLDHRPDRIKYQLETLMAFRGVNTAWNRDGLRQKLASAK